MSKHTQGEGWGWNGDVCAVWGVAITLGTDEEKEQHARLISAAPDLLEALQRVARVALGYTMASRRELDLDGIFAAIAKAEGRTE